MFQEPQNLAADLVGEAENGSGRIGTVGPIGRIGLGALTLVLLAKRLLILGTAEYVVQEDGDEETGEDRQSDLNIDRRGAFAPRLGLGEVVLPGIEAFFFVPAVRERKAIRPAGVPLTAVRDLLGRTTIWMTERYAHLAPENVRAAVLLLEDDESRSSHASELKAVG